MNLFVVAVTLLLLSGVASADTLKAVTEDGKTVVLNGDGTWKYETAAQGFTKPAQATKLLKGTRVRYGLWMDESKWLLAKDKGDSPERDYAFRHVTGDAYAMVIAERLEVPMESLKAIALQNARNATKDVRVTKEEVRNVNGTQVLSLQMEGTIQGIPFVFNGYYYAGKRGTIQVITYTGRNLFEEYRRDMDNLLSGFFVE
jgi:hypothetical protein